MEDDKVNDLYLCQILILIFYSLWLFKLMESNIEDYSKFVEEKKNKFKDLVALNEKNNWQMSEERDGVKIFLKLEENSGLYYIRAEGIVKAPIQKGKETIMNANCVTSYDSTLEIGKEIERIGEKLIFTYTCSKKPNLIVDKRDCVVLSSCWDETDGSVLFAGGSLEHSSYPPKESPVRCEIPIWGWLLTPKDKETTHITYLVLIDPKGWVPKPVINAISTDQAMNVKGLRNLLEGKKEEKKGWFSFQ